MVSTPRRPASEPADDPVYALDRAEALYWLFGGRLVTIAWKPVRRWPDRTEIARTGDAGTRVEISDRMQNLALWSLCRPEPPHHRAVDVTVETLIRKRWISEDVPWRDAPYHAVRMAIAAAAEEAGRQWRTHAAAREMKAFADALQVVDATLADPHAASIAAGLLAIDFDRLPPRHIQAVGTHDQQARAEGLEADFAAVILALRPVRPMLDRIAARGGVVMELVRPNKRTPDPWKRVFAAELTRAWLRMVKPEHSQPSSNDESLYQEFIVAAYRSLGGTQSKSFASSVRSLRKSGELGLEPLRGAVKEVHPPKITSHDP